MSFTDCNTSAECTRFTGTCYNNTCICWEVFGVSGANCDTPSPASIGSSLVLAMSSLVSIIFVISNILILKDLIQAKSKIFKFNLAGRIYAFGWLSLLLTLTSATISVAAPFNDLMVAVFVTDYVSILSLICALINLIVGFLRFTALKGAREKSLRGEWSTWLMIAFLIVFVVILVTAPFMISCYVIGTLFFVTVIIASLSPLLLFIRAMRSRTNCGLTEIFRAVVEESLFRNDAIQHLMSVWEDSRTSLTAARPSLDLQGSEKQDDQKDLEVRTSSFFDLGLSRTGSLFSMVGGAATNTNANSMQQIPRTGSLLSMSAFAYEKQKKKAEFFSRSILAGHGILYSGTGVVGFWLAVAFTLPESRQSRIDVTLPSIFWSLRAICLIIASNVILNFSSHVYRKAIKDMGTDRRSKQQSVGEHLSPTSSVIQPVNTVEQRPNSAGVSWLIKSSEFANRKPLSSKKLRVTSSSGSIQETNSGSGVLTPKTSGKRLVDEAANPRHSHETHPASILDSSKEGAVNKEVEGLIDVWVEDEDHDY
jgi:hypothetical protein